MRGRLWRALTRLFRLSRLARRCWQRAERSISDAILRKFLLFTHHLRGAITAFTKAVSEGKSGRFTAIAVVGGRGHVFRLLPALRLCRQVIPGNSVSTISASCSAGRTEQSGVHARQLLPEASRCKGGTSSISGYKRGIYMKAKDYRLIEAYMLSCMRDSAHDREHIYRSAVCGAGYRLI